MDKRRFPTLGLLILAVLGLATATYGKGGDADLDKFVFSIILLFPIIFSLCLFKFPYSLLGSKVRWSPKGSSPDSTSFANLQCGKWFFRAGTFALVKTYNEGLFIRAFLAGSGFLSFDEIEKVERRFGVYRIFHNSPALRTPLDLSLSKEILARLDVLEVTVEPMSHRSKRWVFLLVALQILLIPLFFQFALSRWEFGGFSGHREHALLVERGILNTVYDLDLETGRKTVLERHWGIGFDRRMLQYRDPEILRMVNAKGEIEGKSYRIQELRYQGKTLTQGSEGYLSPNGHILAYRSLQGTFLMRDIRNPGPPLALTQANPHEIQWAPEGDFVVVAFPSPDGFKIKVYDANGQERHSQYARWAAPGPGAGQFTVLSRGEEARFEIISLAEGKPLKTLPATGVKRFAWHPSGRQLLFLKKDGLYLGGEDFTQSRQVIKTSDGVDFQWSNQGGFFFVEAGYDSSAFYDREGQLVEDFGLQQWVESSTEP